MSRYIGLAIVERLFNRISPYKQALRVTSLRRDSLFMAVTEQAIAKYLPIDAAAIIGVFLFTRAYSSHMNARWPLPKALSHDEACETWLHSVNMKDGDVASTLHPITKKKRVVYFPE
eukprot:GHVN01026341.1.p1 GENE.GHVN01026341.1~~GHVN01026341.1.p1  ORF type:complete len:117 (+),score=13.32 GHVN01026341.1:52-402(+)